MDIIYYSYWINGILSFLYKKGYCYWNSLGKMLTPLLAIFKTLNHYFYYNLLNFDITAPAYNSQIWWFPMGPLYRGSTVFISMQRLVTCQHKVETWLKKKSFFKSILNLASNFSTLNTSKDMSISFVAVSMVHPVEGNRRASSHFYRKS